VRRGTLIAIVVLFVLLGVAAVYQLILASDERERFPGPRPGTPLPEVTTTP
jgi:hypothetical protein